MFFIQTDDGIQKLRSVSSIFSIVVSEGIDNNIKKVVSEGIENNIKNPIDVSEFEKSFLKKGKNALDVKIFFVGLVRIVVNIMTRICI